MPRDPFGLASDLREIQRAGLLRRRFHFQARRPGGILRAGRWLDDFTSNDYLGLSHHPLLVSAAQEALLEHGCGAGSSRVVTGGGQESDALEDDLARYLAAPSCLIFPSGYQANLGVVSSLVGRGDLVFSDQRNHASLVDGCRLSGADIHVYHHADPGHLASLLESNPAPRRLVVTDGLFSMDGDIAPLTRISEVTRAQDALLLVDEAHSFGVLGPGGRGLGSALGVAPHVTVGTFSKSLGGHGAFACGDRSVVDWILNRSRPFIYTTALPPASVAAARAALRVVSSSEGESLRLRALELAGKLRLTLRSEGVPAGGDSTPIVSLSFEDPRAAFRLGSDLQEAGILVWAFRPPTVAPGTSLLRVCISAAHSESAVQRLTDALLSLQAANSSAHLAARG